MRNNLNKFINVQSDDQNNDIEYNISKNKDINTNFITDLNELKSKQDINDINQVYKNLVIKYHPDSHIIDKQSHPNVFEILNKVYGDKIKNIHYVERYKFNINLNDSIMIGNDFIADIQGAAAIGLDSLYIDSNLSPEITSSLQSTFSVMTGNVGDVAPLILNF